MTEFLIARDRVGVKRQALFALVPLLGIWAFYRIQKLRMAIVLITLPGLAGSLAMSGAYFALGGADMSATAQLDGALSWVNIAMFVALTAWSVYLIMGWSKKWNGAFA